MVTLLKFVSVLCIICGFVMPTFQKPELRMFVNVYCSTVLMMQCSICMTFMYMKLYSVVYNVANILELCWCGLASLVVIYYKAKFFTIIKANHSIVQGVIYVDQALEPLQVPVPRAKITIECSLRLLVHTVFVLLWWYNAYILKYSSSTADFMNVSESIYILNIQFSHLILFQYGYLIITVIRQRLQLTRRAFKRLYKCDNRTVAWSHSAAVATVGQPRYSNSVTDIHNTYELLGTCLLYTSRCV